MQQTTILRYAAWTLWFVALPAAFAIAIVVASGEVGSGPSPLGQFGALVREQRVPAGIVPFTLAEMTLYYFRHYLPFAELMAGSGPAGMTRQQRREYEAAQHLLQEGRGILERHRSAIEKELALSVREDLDASLSKLEASMEAEPFDRQAFSQCYDRCSDLIDSQLARWRKSELREYLESVGVAILIALTLRAVVVEAFKIPSGSMLPTLQIDDHIFVNKFDYGPTIPFTKTRIFGDLPPHRGDVIVFEFPDPIPGQVGQDFIKRVVALPGDTLEVADGHPTINGWEVPSCFVGMYTYGARDGNNAARAELYVEFLEDTSYLALYEEEAPKTNQGPFTVGPGEVWVMGDNRHNSHDSRAWRGGRGAGVPYANIQGRALFVWFPLSRIFTPVMGAPELPQGMSPELTQGIQECLAKRPQITTPPPPKK